MPVECLHDVCVDQLKHFVWRHDFQHTACTHDLLICVATPLSHDGCNTMFWETVDGQKIAPLYEWFCFVTKLIACPHLETRRCLSPPLPPVFNVAVRFAFVIFVLSVLVLARRIVDSLSNIKSGGARGGSRIVFIHCGSAACMF